MSILNPIAYLVVLWHCVKHEGEFQFFSHVKNIFRGTENKGFGTGWRALDFGANDNDLRGLVLDGVICSGTRGVYGTCVQWRARVCGGGDKCAAQVGRVKTHGHVTYFQAY